MSKRAAQVLVFLTSGAVLVLEILAGRLMAPYVGVSLETFTGIIGTVLAGIALGSALGGQLADRRDPSTMIGPALVLGGVLAWLAIPVVAVLGPALGNSIVAIIILAFLGFFPSAVVLSAISPMAAKLRLQNLDQTGEVVGGLSAAGTFGALAGTFLTGFVLVAAAPTRPIIIAVGVGLVLWGLVFSAQQRRRRAANSAAARGADGAADEAASSGPESRYAALRAAVILALALTVNNPCEFESAYACGRIQIDTDDDSIRFLWLDTLRHGAVDLDDPTHLEFRYIKVIGDAVDALPDGPIDALHIGGGAFSVPRYINATRPGSTNLVLEIDPLLVDVAERELDLRQGPDLEVRTGDARLDVFDLPTDSYDLIVGDAYGGLSVPWHLTTTEFYAEIARVLRPDGVYVMNAIDAGDNRFVEAQLATLGQHFDHLEVVVSPEFPLPRPSNQILLASNQSISGIVVDPDDGVFVADVAAFTDDGVILTDDFAPVEQLAANL
jgi:SAM-dependent methyltransferase